MTDFNYELAARVRDRIAEVGNDHCRMSTWIWNDALSTDGAYEPVLNGNGEPECGTSACIAGHTIAVARGQFSLAESRRIDPAKVGARLLGLEQCDYVLFSLFHVTLWPEYYREIAETESDAKAMLAILDDILDRKIDPNTLAPI